MSTATKTQVSTQVSNHDVIANSIVNDFNGVNRAFLGEEILDMAELKKRGCTFATIEVIKPVVTRAKHAITGDKNVPIFFEKFTVEVLLNAIYGNTMNKIIHSKYGSEYNYVPATTRTNKIENYRNSRVICHKKNDGEETFYVNYIVLRYISKRVFIDVDGNVIPESEYDYLDGFKKTTREQKAKYAINNIVNRCNDLRAWAMENGLDPSIISESDFDVNEMPSVRQVKFENIVELKLFGKVYNNF